jgi:hypothetical protein
VVVIAHSFAKVDVITSTSFTKAREFLTSSLMQVIDYFKSNVYITGSKKLGWAFSAKLF